MRIQNNKAENDKLLDERYFLKILGQAKTTFDKNVLISVSISLALTEILSLNKTFFLGINIKW